MSDSSADLPDREKPFLPPDWARLQPLLDELVDVPAEQRATRIAELTRGDSALRRQLEHLLAEAERDAPLLDESVANRFNALANDDATPALPAVLADRYRVGKELGRGGMASVYLARDEKHGRDVAIKIIHDLSASLPGNCKTAIHRFDSDRRLYVAQGVTSTT